MRHTHLYPLVGFLAFAALVAWAGLQPQKLVTEAQVNAEGVCVQDSVHQAGHPVTDTELRRTQDNCEAHEFQRNFREILKANQVATAAVAAASR